MEKPTYEYETGLVLSGGGVRGFAHLGVLKALNEKGIFPDVISGVSAGALVGAFYADGNQPEQILSYFTQHSLFHYLEISLPTQGLLKISGLARLLKDHLKSHFFEELQIPLYVCATDLNNGETCFFSSGSLKKIILASSTIPLLIKPMEIDGITYVDGGLLNNLPIEPLLNRCKRIIGVHVNPLGYEYRFSKLTDIAERCFHVSVAHKVYRQAEKCDLFIEPMKLKGMPTLDVSKAKEIYQIGYEEAVRVLDPTLTVNFKKGFETLDNAEFLF
jgi:NTE family protein